MTTATAVGTVAVTLALVAAVTAVGASAVPAGAGQRLYADAAQFVAGALAACVCFAAAGERDRRRGGAGGCCRRRARRLDAVPALVGRPRRRSTRTADRRRPVADVGFLVLPLCAVLAC